MRRAGVPHARRGPVLHGPEGPHRARPLSGRVGGDAVVHRGARGRGVQVGVDPRAEPRALRPADGVLDPDLHAPRDGLPARDLRRLATTRSCGPAPRRPCRRSGSRGRTRRCSRSWARGTWPRARSRPATTVFAWEEVRVWSRTQATLDRFAEKYDDRFSFALFTLHGPRERRRRRRRRRHAHARARADRPRRVDQARRRTSRRSAPTRAATRSSTRASSSGRGSSSTTSASAERTARSTCRSRRA